MALQNVLFGTMLDAGASEIATASMHTADPGSDGSSEISGGSYARQSVSWNTASDGSVATSGEIQFAIPGGNTVTHLGLWSGDATPVWLGGLALSTQESYGADGTYTVTSLVLNLTNA